MEEQLSKFVNDLQLVKEEFIRCKNELKVSVRKDVIKVQLKEILESNDIDKMKKSINELIKTLDIEEESANGKTQENRTL